MFLWSSSEYPIWANVERWHVRKQENSFSIKCVRNVHNETSTRTGTKDAGWTVENSRKKMSKNKWKEIPIQRTGCHLHNFTIGSNAAPNAIHICAYIEEANDNTIAVLGHKMIEMFSAALNRRSILAFPIHTSALLNNKSSIYTLDNVFRWLLPLAPSFIQWWLMPFHSISFKQHFGANMPSQNVIYIKWKFMPCTLDANNWPNVNLRMQT